MGWARLRAAAASRIFIPLRTAAPSEADQQSFFTPNAALRLAVQRFSAARHLPVPHLRMLYREGFWRVRLSCEATRRTSFQKANALSKPYALLIVQGRYALPTDRAGRSACSALKAYA
jgi:hypothetical protein